MMFVDPFAQLQALADLTAARNAATEFLKDDSPLTDLSALTTQLDTAIRTVKELA